MRQTRASWDEVERYRSASPLSTLDAPETLVGLVREAIGKRIDAPTDFVVTLALVADTLLTDEDCGDFNPRWELIEADASVAVEFREVLTRRRRWALDYDRLMPVFRRQLLHGYRELVEALPEGCFEGRGHTETPFSVPLSSVLEEPARAIERLMLSVYSDEVFQLDLFKRFRAYLAGNLAVASGFSRDADTNTVAERLVMPTRHKSTNAAELTALYLGGTPFEDILNFPVPFRVPEAMRFEHCHVIGGTGHGKTQLLQRMVHADLVAAREDGRSVVVIDSQGDLIQKLVRLSLFDPSEPGSLADRLVLIDPADVEYPPALNLFDAHEGRLHGYGPPDRERTLNGLIELYETFFGALLGAELTQRQGVIFRYLARLMLAIPGATIHTLMQVMEDGKPFRAHMKALDGSARHFFATEFFHPSFAATKKQILKRLWGVLSTPAFERMFAQRENKVDMFEATNAGKIILISTAKDLLKTDGSALFGRFFIAMLAQAALERSVIPERNRTATSLYVDEAQEYFDDTIETILSQARKYKLGITAAHQTLDQLSPGLRAAFLANTSFKCVGGVSSKDARALASELHTTSDFIESMRKRRDHTEFAVWLKGRTPQALQLDVPLGFLERQETLSNEQFDLLLETNRLSHCGTLADVLAFEPAPAVAEAPPAPVPVADEPATRGAPAALMEPQPRPTPSPRPPVEARELGKGSPKHRYLQTLVKEIAEGQGFKATIEAPLPNASGQVDVLLERDELRVAVEVSVSTNLAHEQDNVRKCLDAGYQHVALVIAKSRAASERFRTSILDPFSAEERARVSALYPEDVPDFVAAVAPVPEPAESVVKGYRVRLSRTAVPPEEARERRDRLAKLVARSLRREE